MNSKILYLFLFLSLMACQTATRSYAHDAGQINIHKIMQEAVIKASGKVTPAVVHIEAYLRQKQKRMRVIGSGVLVNADGIILTNAHVVNRAEKVTITVPGNKKPFKGEVVGTDTQTDLAVVKIDFEGSPPEIDFPKFGDSDALKVGEWVIAIGNPFGLDGTVSLGIVSAKRRDLRVRNISQFIQTDAMIDPGSSGGPLINLDGEIVGINSLAQGRGIGFTIPINHAETIMKSILKEGKIKRSWLGVTLQPLTRELAEYMGMPEQAGVIVNWPVTDSPAEKAGILQGDIIYSFNGAEVESETAEELKKFMRMVAEYPQNEKVKIGIIRNGEKTEVYPTLMHQPVMESDEIETEYGFIVKEITHGIFVNRLLDSKNGVYVSYVDRGSLASEAGLVAGDILVWLGGTSIVSTEDFHKAIDKVDGKEKFLIKFKRGRDLIVGLVKKRGAK